MTALWEAHDRAWRRPEEVVAGWADASSVDPALLSYRTRGPWWDLLEEQGITLLVTREYEHFALALGAPDGRPVISYLPIPHPSGMAVDRVSGTVSLASTRNPNQVVELRPAATGAAGAPAVHAPLVPTSARWYAGRLYLHDLAWIAGRLHANAVGSNAIVAFDDGSVERVWSPRCLDDIDDRFDRNYLQLNSIAAGADVESSYFSASTDEPSPTRRPGHRNFAVDGRGVLFAGSSREPVVRGLTRPHSARFHNGDVWVANSGYGELVRSAPPGYDVVGRLPGWTRGLCFSADIAFVGSSRVIPRFRHYAPGVDLERSRCGVHAVSTETGEVVASIEWPKGNQIFAVDWLPSSVSQGFAFRLGRRSQKRERELFFSFRPAARPRANVHVPGTPARSERARHMESDA